jgi:hypothetical protein
MICSYLIGMCLYVLCFRGKYALIIGFSLWICYIGMFPRTVPSNRDPGFALTSIIYAPSVGCVVGYSRG